LDPDTNKEDKEDKREELVAGKKCCSANSFVMDINAILSDK
jgi:hypothetical protein